MSLRASAKATLAWMKPSFEPQSKVRPLIGVGVEGLAFAEPPHGVGQLDLVAGAALLGAEELEHLGLQDIAAIDVVVRGRRGRRRLFDHLGHRETAAHRLALADDAVFVRLGRIALLDGDDVAAGLLVELHDAGQAAPFAERNHVRQQQREGLVADDVAGAPDGVTEPVRRPAGG